MRKEKYSIVLMAAGCIALNFLYSPLSDMFTDDKEIFKYIGLVIYKGGSPYTDAFDHKPPLIYFLNSLSWFVSSWLPWILDCLFVLLATLLLYGLCKKNKMPWPWFLPLIFNLLIRYSLVSYGDGMTREYSTVFIMIFFCVMMGNARYKYYLLGLLTSLILWMQQDALFTLAPFIFYSLLPSRALLTVPLAKKILSLTIGFILATAPILLFFLLHHSLAELWKDAFLFNLQPPGEHVSFWQKLKVIKHAIHEVEFEMPFYAALILGAASLFLKPGNAALLYASLAALLLSFSGEYLTGRLQPGNAFTYYLLPLAATIPIVVWVSFTNPRFTFFRDKAISLIFYLMLSTVLILGTLRFTTVFHLQTGSFEGLPETEYLDKAGLGDYQLYIFDDSNLTYYYNRYSILAPSPWIYQYFWTWSAQWDQNKTIFHSIIYDIQKHRTRFILDCSVMRKGIKNKEIYDEWQNFLNAHYFIVLSDSFSRRLWKIQ